MDIYLDRGAANWTELPISILNRVAELGHFERFGIWEVEFDEVVPLAQALIRAIRANPQLTHLDLCGNSGYVDWTPHLRNIFEAMGKHTGLRKLVVKIATEEFDYSILEKLLSRNRNIVVVNGSGRKYSNGSSIDKLYSLNRFYRGSTALMKASTALRPQLVATTLGASASGNVQYTTLLLANHTDMVCEFVDGLELELVLLDD